MEEYILGFWFAYTPRTKAYVVCVKKGDIVSSWDVICYSMGFCEESVGGCLYKHLVEDVNEEKIKAAIDFSIKRFSKDYIFYAYVEIKGESWKMLEHIDRWFLAARRCGIIDSMLTGDESCANISDFLLFTP